MRIRTEQQWETWYAYDEDTYDGAPDGHSPVGCGMSERSAIDDLVEQLLGALESQLAAWKIRYTSKTSETDAQEARGGASDSPGIPTYRTPTNDFLEAYSEVYTEETEKPLRCCRRMEDLPEDRE